MVDPAQADMTRRDVMADDPDPPKSPVSILTGVVILSLSIAAIFLLLAELHRIDQGRLFLFALPFDAAATRLEVSDAQQTVREYRVPALLTLPLLLVFTAFAVPRAWHHALPPTRRWWIAFSFFTLAALADCLTTLWFFHQLGVEHELHPGIRLFGYAYGRTIGPILGKGVQFVGIVLLSRLSNRYGTLLMWIAGSGYFIAAIYNVLQTNASAQL